MRVTLLQIAAGLVALVALLLGASNNALEARLEALHGLDHLPWHAHAAWQQRLDGLREIDNNVRGNIQLALGATLGIVVVALMVATLGRFWLPMGLVMMMAGGVAVAAWATGGVVGAWAELAATPWEAHDRWLNGLAQLHAAANLVHGMVCVALVLLMAAGLAVLYALAASVGRRS